MPTDDTALWRLGVFLALLTLLSLIERLRPGPNPSSTRRRSSRRTSRVRTASSR